MTLYFTFTTQAVDNDNLSAVIQKPKKSTILSGLQEYKQK